mmetsp:Transcript_38541/g.62729  ORF Transcript_38541/g.62729 Transcript_38541/m.62729 type:complete len:96 (-) Transcript_38541:88-375(-)
MPQELHYTEAGNKKQSLLSRSGAVSVRHHLETPLGGSTVGDTNRPLVDNCLVSEGTPPKERHLAVESNIFRRLLLEQKRAPSPGGMRDKRLCTNP